MMNFQQVIQASATVIRITELKKFDIVKLIDEENGDAKLTYGVVEDVLNDGAKGFVQFNVIKKDYYGCSMIRRVLAASAEKQPAIFPATQEEIKTFFDEVEKTLNKQIIEAEKGLSDKQAALKEFTGLRSNENLLTSPKYIQ